ncbi:MULTISPECIES: hypothetical protein [Pseudomonas]|uniref:hypothetical protein n=1 Tax=Pseudomonas TaxID=286 RepID=UPI002DB94C59|nr:hypothetical protein [Pseudomonas asiatica]MEB6588028.1 hypothetical protein [Pseudomonas asiatica]
MKQFSLVEHVGLQCLEPHICSYALKGLQAVNAGTVSVKATTAEYFAQAVYDRVGELDSTLASLRLVVRLLGEISQASDPDPEVYRYHYENFIFRGIGAVDRAFLLVADALLLSKRARKTNQLIAEQVEKHPAVRAALLAVKASMEPYRKSRNVVAHDSAYSSRELGILSGVRQMKVECQDVDVPALSREVFATQVQAVCAAIAELETKLHELMAALQPIFAFVAQRAGEIERERPRKRPC